MVEKKVQEELINDCIKDYGNAVCEQWSISGTGDEIYRLSGLINILSQCLNDYLSFQEPLTCVDLVAYSASAC